MTCTMYAHADANSFYASCEQIFAPSLKSKGVVILSNNDGCVIARSAEAIPFIPMGAPIHQWKQAVEDHGIQVLSANFAGSGTNKQDMVASEGSSVLTRRSLPW
jgi:DNA polymerase V